MDNAFEFGKLYKLNMPKKFDVPERKERVLRDALYIGEDFRFKSKFTFAFKGMFGIEVAGFGDYDFDGSEVKIKEYVRWSIPTRYEKEYINSLLERECIKNDS